jgi:hypothetical protein
VLYRFAERLAESASDDEGDSFSDTRKTVGRRAGIRRIRSIAGLRSRESGDVSVASMATVYFSVYRG